MKRKILLSLLVCLMLICLATCLAGCDDHEHSYKEKITKPTCTEKGFTTYTCECGNSYVGNFVEKLPHTEEWVVDIEATCATEGSKHKQCSICKSILSIEKVPTTAHTEEIDKAVEPTCSEAGLTQGKHCKICGEVLAEQKVVEKLQHTPSDWIVDKKATCTMAGSKHKQCISCQKVLETEEIAKLPHTSGEWIVDIIATCTEQGSRHKVCTKCNTILAVEKTDTAAHNTVSHIGQNATCTASGWYAYETCQNCSYTTYRAINALGHTPKEAVEENKIEATCDKKGSYDTVIYCSVCKAQVSRKTTDISALGHKLTHTAKVEPTCTESGSVEYWHCSVCKNDYSDENCANKVNNLIIPALDHDYSSPVCSRCNITLENWGLTFLLNQDGKGYTVEAANLSISGEIAIPSTYKNLPVTAIGDRAFFSCKDITSITIPDSVASIGNNAFMACSSLTSITIPDSVISLGTNVFVRCNSLTSVTIGSGVTSLSNGTFAVCEKLTSVILPNGITSIGSNAFRNCINLKNVTIGSNVTSIGDNAFYGCYKLVEVYNLSSLNITKGSYDNGYVGYYALGVYTSLDTPSKLVTNNDGYVFYENGEEVYFYEYTGKEASLVLPDKFNNKNYAIYNYALSNNKNITSVTLPNSVTSIGSYAFLNCDYLTSVMIGNSVTSIGEFAFRGCASLTSVTIGNGVTSIGEYAFLDCYKLLEVYNLSSLNITKGGVDNGCVGYYALAVYNSIDTPSELLTISDGYVFYENDEGAYLVDYKGTQTELVLPDKFNNKNYAIYQFAFYNKNITSVTIGNGVTSIGCYAFRNCDNLTSITIGGNVTTIGDNAFYDCDGLTSVTIGNSVTTIGSYAFGYCDSLTSVTIGGSVTSIGASAFRWCDSLTSVTIPESVTSIGESAFDYCLRLTSVIFEDTANWSVGNGSTIEYITLLDSSTNAKYLTSTYSDYIWTKII